MICPFCREPACDCGYNLPADSIWQAYFYCGECDVFFAKDTGQLVGGEGLEEARKKIGPMVQSADEYELVPG